MESLLLTLLPCGVSIAVATELTEEEEAGTRVVSVLSMAIEEVGCSGSPTR